jgi:hypothetical protein
MVLHRSILTAALAIILAAPGLANAALIQAPVGATVDFAAANYFGSGAVAVAPGISWSSTNTNEQRGSVFGYDKGYGFGENGFSNDVVVGLNDSSDAYGVVDSMTFSFDHPVSSIGAVLNWVPTGAPVTIAAYDASDQLLDSLTLSQGGANLVAPDAFYGFQERSSEISSFVLTDGYVAAIGGLDVGAVNISAVPEPASWAMMLVGFGGLGVSLRLARRRSGIAMASLSATH